MEKIVTLENYCRVETFGLSEEQHDIVVEMVKKNQRKNKNYTLEKVDDEMVNIWLSDADSEGNEEYAEFLRESLAKNAEIVTLTDHLGDFSQPIGEVAIYD
jgi:nucleoid-associated protein YejK